MRRVALFLIVLCLAACGGMGGTRTPEQALAAERAFAAGDFAAAAEAFLDAAAVSRGRGDFYRLRAAESWRENADWDAAERALADLQERRLEPDAVERLALLRAELALQRRDREAAIAALEPLGRGPRSAALQARFLELRGRALQRSQPLEAARMFAELGRLLQGRERSENAKRIRGLLAGRKDAELRALAETLRADDALTAPVARALRSRGYSVPDHLRARDPAADSLQAGAAPRRVAVLLPGSGPLASAAAAVRDGLLAARLADATHQAEVRIVDSGETPEAAIAAYRRAVAEGADAVVGPLDRASVQALLGEADLPVPVLALNRAEAVEAGHAAFALAPEDEGAAIAARLQRQDRSRVVAVVSADDAAQRALAMLRQRLEASGGSILAEIVIDETQVNHQERIRLGLQGAGLPTSRPPDLNLPHDPGFDALVLAVRPQAARLVVPQLKLFGLSEVPMLSTSLIFANGGQPQLDRELSGIEFCDVPWMLDDLAGLPARSLLGVGIDSLQGGSARLFAFGMDAWQLVRTRRIPGDEWTLQGATGMLSLDDSGEVLREPAFAVFRNGRPQRISEGTLVSDGEPKG